MKIKIHLHQHGGCVSGHAEILSKLEEIMSAITDFAEAQSAHNNVIDQAIEGLTADVTALKRQITDLQNAAGLTPAEQQLLDAILTRTAGMAERLTALDALTPPVVPNP